MTENQYKELCSKEFPEDEKHPRDWWEHLYPHLVSEREAMDEFEPDDSLNDSLPPYYCDLCPALNFNYPAAHWSCCG